MKKLLITGFEPFGGETINPALEAVLRLPDTMNGATIIKLQVPVVYDASAETVLAAMEREQPDAVLCVGQAGGRNAITPERVAINMDDASSADNSGEVRTDTPIAPDGPAAYFATLPVKRMVAAAQAKGVACRLSNSAGTYVCNHLMYAVLHHAAVNRLPVQAGFLHVPYIPEQTESKPGMPSMTLDEIVKGLEACISTIIAQE